VGVLDEITDPQASVALTGLGEGKTSEQVAEAVTSALAGQVIRGGVLSTTVRATLQVWKVEGKPVTATV